MDFFTCKIQPEKSIDNFALHLCTFSIQLCALQVVVTEFQLTNTFVYGLCNNFHDIKASHNKKTIKWCTHSLEWAKREANGINKISSKAIIGSKNLPHWALHVQHSLTKPFPQEKMNNNMILIGAKKIPSKL
eukprot:7928148-Ditylum_brightwellii.AAC.1